MKNITLEVNMPIGFCAYAFTYRTGNLGKDPDAYGVYRLIDLVFENGLKNVEFPRLSHLRRLEHALGEKEVS